MNDIVNEWLTQRFHVYVFNVVVQIYTFRDKQRKEND